MQLHDGIAEVVDDVGGRHRDLPLVRLRQVARHAVQVHRELARRLGVEELREPRGDHPREHVARAAGGHARIAGGVDEYLVVGRRDQRAMALEDDVHVMRDGEVAGDLERGSTALRRWTCRPAAPFRPDAA